MVQRKGCRKGTYGFYTNKRVLRNYKSKFIVHDYLNKVCDDDWDQLNREISNHN